MGDSLNELNGSARRASSKFKVQGSKSSDSALRPLRFTSKKFPNEPTSHRDMRFEDLRSQIVTEDGADGVFPNEPNSKLPTRNPKPRHPGHSSQDVCWP